jgi:hypothetical protein
LGFRTVLKGLGNGGPNLGRPWTDVSDKQLLFLCEETGPGDAAMSGKSSQAHTFLSMENSYETHSLATAGPKDRGWFALPPCAFDSLPYRFGVFVFA